VTIIPLAPASRPGSSNLPEGSSSRATCVTQSGAPSLSQMHSASRASSPLLFGLAPRGVCHAPDVATGAVGSYPTFSPLPATAPFEMSRRFSFELSPGTFRRRYILCGTFRDVVATAAFAAIPTAPPGVTRRVALLRFHEVVSGLSSRSACAKPAIIRLTRQIYCIAWPRRNADFVPPRRESDRWFQPWVRLLICLSFFRIQGPEGKERARQHDPQH
jgi:hypothetical protein